MGSPCRLSMGHCIDDEVDAEPVGRCRHWRRVMRVVGMFPGVAHVDVVIDRDQKPPMIVVDTPPMRRAFHALPAQMPFAGYLRPIVEVEKDAFGRGQSTVHITQLRFLLLSS